MLWRQRSQLAAAGHLRLHQLLRFDQRLLAQLDGVTLAGEEGWAICEAALDQAAPGAVFTIAVLALESRRSDRVERALRVGTTGVEAEQELIAAFEWVERDRLSGIVAPLLTSATPIHRLIGTAACAAHRVDPGVAAALEVTDADPSVRARHFQTAGELGRDQLLSVLTTMVSDADPECSVWAAWAAVLLGDRHSALDALTDKALATPQHSSRPLDLVLQARTCAEAHRVLEQVAQQGERGSLVRGAGMVGDVSYVEWLMSKMQIDHMARAAGEAFTLITGADLALLDLERKPPENFEAGPNDNPDDTSVDMDADEGLPWPDPQKIELWWAANSSRFQQGIRYFMGKPATREHCIQVLKTGYQRQRILAAHYLCLLEPGTPLFNTSGPVWRQQKLLASM